MRQLIFVSLVLFFGVLVHAKAPLSFLKEKIKSDSNVQKRALNFALQQRCNKYFRDLDQNIFSTMTECKRETDSFIQALDIQVVQLKDPRSGQVGSTTIAFHTQLVKMMNQVSTHYALMELESELQLSDAKPFQLYQILFRLFKNDLKVVQFIAVLFQDTTEAYTHIHYLKNLEIPKSRLFLSNLEQLKKVHKMFFDLQRTRVWKKNYQLYPLSIELAPFPISPTQYHFYVISYAAQLMASEVRLKSADKIVFVATAFNYLYERFYRFSFSSAFNDELVLSDKSSEDVMLGFLAALYGVGLHSQSLESFPNVQKNPGEFFRTTLKDLKTFFP